MSKQLDYKKFSKDQYQSQMNIPSTDPLKPMVNETKQKSNYTLASPTEPPKNTPATNNPKAFELYLINF